jgi:glycosyltransferase involved in cell wall biosynthesis
MKILETEYDVSYYEPWDDIPEDSVVLYWEAPCTINGSNKQHYERVHNLPNKKILLFAGGPMEPQWVENFDMVVVESKINAEECDKLGIPNTTAFGVNTDIFKPLDEEKKWLASAHGTCASWKRQWLLCQALGEEACVFGARQATDSRPFDECEKCNSTVIDEVPYNEAVKLLNQSWVSVNCADFWGGGQRATLEAMACDIPVVVMKDSPKNREFVEESGVGAVVDPQPERIKEAVADLQGLSAGREYVMSKWTPRHYADNLEKAIILICTTKKK